MAELTTREQDVIKMRFGLGDGTPLFPGEKLAAPWNYRGNVCARLSRRLCKSYVKT